ncbi:MAG: rhomboid family intramembrane serine protease, partial [Loktanella sp.]|nr:rhomboid family intramembrane serine protease [Loktanella sp.]
MLTMIPQPVQQFMIACIILEALSFGGQILGLGNAIRDALVAVGGFWPGLLGGMQPAFSGQAIAMFATSAVLHGNPTHLAMNLLGLMWLGPMVVNRLGDQGFWPLAGLSALGAGLCYALLSDAYAPMVGASGVLYGLLGAVAVWLVLDRTAQGESLTPYAIDAAVLLGANVILTLPARNQIAWEAHLGGFI